MIFVTGGTGLLGSHLLLELTKTNDEITAIYNSEKKIQTVKKLFQYYAPQDFQARFDKIAWKKCNILDIPNLEELIEGHKEVYHCAAIVSFKKKDFNNLIKVNREGTANMVNLSLAFGVKKFCFVSSTAAIGEKDIMPDGYIDETTKWETTPDTSGYSISKYSAEKEVWRGIEEGLNAVIVNPSVVFGAGNWDESSLVIFKTVEKGLKFYPPGKNAFVDARDVAKIMTTLMHKNAFNERYLLIGENLAFKTVFDLIAKSLNKKGPKYPVNKIFMEFAWRVSVFFAVLTFRSPVITKATARSAFNKKQYSNKKIKEKLNHQFYTIEESINNAVQGRIN